MSSQRTFQAILGKFSAGLDILKNVIGYNPSKNILKISSLEAQKADAEAKNSAVLSAETTEQDLRKSQRFMAFKSKDSDENCLENRIKAIANYIKAEHDAKYPAYLQVTSIISKIQPPSEKKAAPAEGEVPKKSISKSEKSFQSLVGFGNDVHTIISNLGADYNPSNTNITVANFRIKVDELASLNSEIVTAEKNYSTAVQERNEAYNGEAGINSTISSIKDYLASLEGGKKNPDYVAYVNAVK